MKKYLFATDGSPTSERALEYLIEHVDPKDEITLLHVIPNPSDGFLRKHDSPEIAESRLREAAEDITDKAMDKINEAGLDAELVILMGQPGEEICGLAGDMGTDTIVMGRQGTSAVSDILLGSVSKYVIHHAPCAVTIVPSE